MKSFVIVISLPQICLALHSPCAFTRRPRAWQLQGLGCETRRDQSWCLHIQNWSLHTAVSLGTGAHVRIMVGEMVGYDSAAVCGLLRPKAWGSFLRDPST